ncbi:MAG: glycosyltransferase family 87 protein, partial [Calditrichia bacterium]
TTMDKTNFTTKFQLLKNLNFVLGLYVVITIIASVLEYFKGPKIFNGIEYTHYNNFLIFKHSFFHLIENKDLYTLLPGEYWDYYKYSPTFALLFAPIAILPNLPGLIVWNLLNTIPLFFAIRFLIIKKENGQTLILWFILLELLTSIQNSQSNGLMAALIIGAFVFMENRKAMWGALSIVLSFYIKLFGIVGGLFFLMYPSRLKSVGYALLWGLLLGLLPFLSISPEQYFFLLKSWLNLLINDQSISYGRSLLGLLHSWFNLNIPKLLLTVIGGTILVLPLIKKEIFDNKNNRILLLSSVLIWMVIFNHKAESSTYIIAVCGVAIWYFTQKGNTINRLLLLATFILTCLSPTDLFPRFLRDNFVLPFELKALGPILIWFKIQYTLFSNAILRYKQVELKNS